MIDRIANEIQAAYMYYQSTVTLGAAITFIGGGLVVWLAGLGIGRIAFAVIGAFCGCIGGYLFKPGQEIILLFGVVLGSLAGIVVEVIVGKILGSGGFSYNLFLSAVSAFTGTLSIFLGLILLLMLKGAKPLSYILARQKFYMIVAGVMIVFGLFEQLLLCKKPYQHVTKTVKAKKQKKDEPDEKSEWRNK